MNRDTRNRWLRYSYVMHRCVKRVRAILGHWLFAALGWLAAAAMVLAFVFA